MPRLAVSVHWIYFLAFATPMTKPALRFPNLRSVRILCVPDVACAMRLCNAPLREHCASFSGMRRWLQYLGGNGTLDFREAYFGCARACAWALMRCVRQARQATLLE